MDHDTAIREWGARRLGHGRHDDSRQVDRESVTVRFEYLGGDHRVVIAGYTVSHVWMQVVVTLADFDFFEFIRESAKATGAAEVSVAWTIAPRAAVNALRVVAAQVRRGDGVVTSDDLTRLANELELYRGTGS